MIHVSIDDNGMGDESLDKSVVGLRYLGGDERSMNVQMELADAKAISPDIRDPDQLKIEILQPQLFIDSETGLLMEKESLNLDTPIQPQMTKVEY